MHSAVKTAQRAGAPRRHVRLNMPAQFGAPLPESATHEMFDTGHLAERAQLSICIPREAKYCGTSVAVEAPEGTRGRECQAQTDVRTVGPGKHRHWGCTGANAVAPSATREVARNMTGEHQGSILRACQAARLSRAAHYKPRVDQSERDRDVVDALNEIVAVELRWEFWKCFDRLRAMGRSPKTRFIGAHSRGLCDALKRAYGGRQSHSNQWVICSVSSLWCTLTTG